MADDYGQMVQQVAEDLSHPSTSTFKNRIRSAIIDAIRELEVEALWFNTADFTLTTVVGQEEYAPADPGPATANELPEDWLYPHSSTLHMRYAGDTNNIYTLRVVNRQQLRGIHAVYGDSNSTPEYFAYQRGSLFLMPKPQLATHVIYGTYVKELTSPTKTYNGSSWTYSADSTTSAWFEADKGEPLVRAKTKELIARNSMKDEMLERRMRDEVTEKLGALRLRSSRKQRTSRIRGRFF